MVMKKADYVSDAIQVKSTREEINEVSKLQGGIGAVSEGFYKLNAGQTKILGTTPITRPLGLITVGPPKPEVQKVISFFQSPEGKKYIQ
jgi:ABC-type phosphate transport system substrate-binding protein